MSSFVPLPISTTNATKITFTPSSNSSFARQQPHTHPIAHFNSKPHPNPTSSLLDVNSSYILYSVKNGLVRVMERESKSNLRMLLRGHSNRISDVSFFNNAMNRNDVLGTVAGRDDDESSVNGGKDDVANVLIWRIYKREGELASEKLLEVRLKDAIRIVWHPFNPNQFILLHHTGSNNNAISGDSEFDNEEEEFGGGVESKMSYSIVATFIETTRLMTVKHETEGHAVCICAKPDEVDGTITTASGGSGSEGGNSNINVNSGSLKLVCFGPKSKIGIHDLCWSNQDARHVITAHKDGTIKLWDLREIVHLDVKTGNEVDNDAFVMRQQRQKVGGSVSSGNSTASTIHVDEAENVVESVKCIMTLNANVTNETGVDGEVQRCMFLPSFDDASCTLKEGGKSSLDSGVYNMTSPFLTVMKQGKCVTLWSPFTTTGSPPCPVRTFEFDGCAPETVFNVSLCTVPNGIRKDGSTSQSALPSSYVLFADKNDGNIHALHLNSIRCTAPPTVPGGIESSISAVNGFDYIVPFRVTQPIYSWTTMVSASSDDDNTDVGEDAGWKIDLFCVQSKSVQQLSLTKAMLSSNPKTIIQLDEDDLPDGLTVENLAMYSSLKNVISDDDADDLQFEDEEYEIEDNIDVEYEEYDDDEAYDDKEDDDEDEDDDIDDSNDEEETFDDIPPPPMPSFAASDNDSAKPSSFANWLGNLAGISTDKKVKKEVEVVPPTPQVTPHATPSVPVKMTIDLSDVPLPTIPDESIVEESVPTDFSNVEKAKPTQRYLSPIDMLLAATTKESIKGEEEEEESGAKAASTPIQENDEPKNSSSASKSDKKELKKKSSQKSKNVQPVPIPSKDGKIAILKREDTAPKKTNTEIKQNMSVPVSGVTKEDVEEIIRKAISNHFQKQENVITAEIQKAVRYEVQSGLVPTLNKTVSQTLDQTVTKTMKSSVTKSVKEATKINADELATEIAAKLKDPLVESFYKSMRELMIPAFESGTRQMFEQISSSIEKGLEIRQKEKDDHTKALEAMSKRMDAMARTMEVLIQGVAKVTVGASASVSSNAPTSPPAVDKIELLKGKINDLILAGDYEKAFTTALSASNPDIAVWTCENSDLSTVLESETPKLSQPIMLCLMQQLGADFPPQKDDDLRVKLSWLQSISLSLDPQNESIRKHVVAVCQQLITNLQKKMAEPNVILRREMQMLIQVVRGMCI